MAKEGLVKGFGAFIQQYGVLPLAIGVVVGTAVNDLVKSLVDGVVTPLISLLAPRQGIQGFQVTIHGSVFKVGQVVGSLITFLVVMWIVYVGVKYILRRDELLEKK